MALSWQGISIAAPIGFLLQCVRRMWNGLCAAAALDWALSILRLGLASKNTSQEYLNYVNCAVKLKFAKGI